MKGTMYGVPFELVPIRVEQRNKYQPSGRSDADAEQKAVLDLALDLEANGQLNPIEVAHLNDKYIIIEGNRRGLAASIVGLPTLLARIYHCSSQEQYIELRMKIQRSSGMVKKWSGADALQYLWMLHKDGVDLNGAPLSGGAIKAKQTLEFLLKYASTEEIIYFVDERRMGPDSCTPQRSPTSVLSMGQQSWLDCQTDTRSMSCPYCAGW